MIEVEVDIEGNPKGPIKGNCLCWLGNLEYVTKDASDPDKKLLTNYNKRQKRFGEQCVGKDTRVVSAFQNYCELVGIKRARSINNMWAKKSFATTTLGVMQLPAAQVMVTTGHRLEQTVREFYYPSRLSFIPNSLLSTRGSMLRVLRWTRTVIFEGQSSWHASWMERIREYRALLPRCTRKWLISPVGTDVQKEMVSKVNSLWEETMSNRVMLHSIYRQSCFFNFNERINSSVWMRLGRASGHCSF